MKTSFLPSLSIIHGATFVGAPANTSATDEGIARIFDSLALGHHSPFNYGHIPISPLDPGFEEKGCPAAAIFTALIARLRFDASDCEEILITHRTHSHLVLQHYSQDAQDNNAGGSGPSGGGGLGGGGGPSGGGNGQSKRKSAGGNSSPSAGVSKKKPRKAADGEGAAGCDRWWGPSLILPVVLECRL